jgi:MFS family permease
MKLSYNQLNKILGWSVFVISLTVYWLTVEPTVSFWDAGEYITTSAKLEVGHPPGAPLYQMMIATAAIFATDVTKIAYMVNLMAAFSSAFTILFMFWSITLLLKRHIIKDRLDETMVLGAAFIGSLTYAVSDSFWFNAVEAEVYAPASLIMASLFYLGLLWERDMMEPRGNRWLILMSFIIGLSFGVHFLGILTIPAIGMLWYFRHYKKVTPLNFIVAIVSVTAVLLFVFKLLLPSTLSIFGYLEVFFVNDIGFPFNSGTIIAFILIVAAFMVLLSLSRKRNTPLLNTITICIMFVLIGFSSWTMLPIRANAGTPINENNPNDARALLAYYNREQYPSPALFYGESFTDMYAGLDPDDPYTDEKPKYERNFETGKYVIVNQYENAVQNSNNAHKGIFPRMTDGSRASNYVDFMGGLDYEIKPGYQGNQELLSVLDDYQRQFDRGRITADEYISTINQLAQSEAIDITKPSFSNNISYLLNYQVNYMYLRYFMWNFVGKQNDEQGNWDRFDGNWMSGITFIDSWRLGSQDNLSQDMLNNKGRNFYFFLPLLLGVLGAVFHAKKDPKSFIVTLMLFLFTGLAIIVYLNQSMFQVRERDYAYVGSFSVFAMWIGIGVYALFDGIREKIDKPVLKYATLGVCLLAVPLLMGFQNWDDHDRSEKYTALASAKKYLDSCLPNALLFTIGDNDTFPLWYAQEVEGYRTDVRVVCTSLLSTDWYMDDMKKQAYESAPVPSTLTHDKYVYGTRDALWYGNDNGRIQERLRQAQQDPNYIFPDTMNLDKWMDWVSSDKKITQELMRNDHYEHTFPTRSIRIPVDKKAVLSNGVVAAKNADKIVDEIIITINSSLVYKNRMFMLDIINANNWERPIYFSGGAFGDEDYIWMKDYLQLDGNAYRLTPIYTPPQNQRDPFDMGRVDPDYTYKIIKGWDWGNSGSPDIYHDVETRRNSVGYRSNVTRAAMALIEDGQNSKAEEILDLGMEKMPLEYFGHYSMIEPFVRGYYELGNKQKAGKLLNEVILKYQDELNFYKALPAEEQAQIGQEVITAIERYRGLVQTAIDYEDDKEIEKQFKKFNSYVIAFSRFYSEEEQLKMPGTEKTQELIDLLGTEIDNADAVRTIEPMGDTVRE